MHWMDRVQVWALKRGHCFKQGWGDLAVADYVEAQFTNPDPPHRIAPELGEPTRVLGADLRVCHFDSPMAGLPPEVQRARFWWLHPADRPVRGVVVCFASWGDEGPTLRGRMVGPLVREGVSILILENPFYGCRRRLGQRAGGLLTVQDMVTMQGAASIEARALVNWARQTIPAPLAAVGFSMGAHLAAGVAGTLAGEVPLVAAAPPLCPSEPFTAGPLSICVDWDALGGDHEDNHHRWRALMDRFDIRKVDRPARPESIRLIGCSHDGLVPPGHTDAIADRWRVPVDWHAVGHVGLPISRSRLVRQGVREVLGLPARGRRPELAGGTEPEGRSTWNVSG